MKKLLIILLTIYLALSIVSCGEEQHESSDTSDNYSSEQQEIPLHYVDSSAFSEVGYRDGTLVVVFHNSGPYQYTGISESLYHNFINSDSLGGFYNDYIKGQYPSEKL